MAREDVPVRPPVDVVRPVTARDLPAEDHWPAPGPAMRPKADRRRAVAGVLEEHRPVLYSRQGGDLGALAPAILDELHDLPVGTVLDGELCAVIGDRLDFTALARRRGRDRRRWPPIVYLAFDCLAITGTALRARPL